MPPSYVSWTFRAPHTVISSKVENYSSHSALSCSLRRSIPVFRYHTYDIIPSCKKDPSASLGMTLRKRRFPNISFIRDVGYPFSPLPSFRAQREIFLALRHFLLLSQKVSRFPLSHIGRYTGVPERSLHFGRDDDTGIAFSKYIRCTLREITPSPIPSFRAQREIFLALRAFLLLSQNVSPFPLSHIRRYTSMPERSLDFARDDDTGITLSQHILYTMHGISPYDAKEKSPSQSWSFFVSERLICQTVRAWCLLLLQYQ